MPKDTRIRMIETTARLLQHRGYHGTSLSDILETSGAPRGSLYFHFPGGKDQLVIEATRTAVDATTRELRETLAKAENPAAGICRFVEAVADLLVETDYTFGCPVAPVILDATADLTELAKLCRTAFEEWIEMLRTALTEAGLAEQRANRLAMLVVATIEGGLLIARSYRAPEPLRSLAAELEATVAAALP